MSDGWIKIHRSILDDELYFSEKFTRIQAWIDLLLLAEYKPREFYVRGIQVKLERGQLAVSIRDLAARWKWGVNKVQSFIKELVASGKLNTQKSPVINIITVCKYDYYQNDDSTLRLKTDTQTDTQTDTPLRNNKESKEDINSSPAPLSRAEADSIINQLAVMMKKIEELSDKTEALQDGAGKQANKKKDTNPLITKGREVFEARYSELFENAYYWQAKDAVAMGSLTKKLTHSRKEKGLGTSDDEVISALRVFLSLIRDEWILKNFSVTTIDSKYNEIVSQAKAAKNANNGNSRSVNSAAEQRTIDAANTIAEFISRGDNAGAEDEDITGLWK